MERTTPFGKASALTLSPLLAKPLMPLAAAAPASLKMASIGDLVILIVAGTVTFWAGVALALIQLRPRIQARKQHARALEREVDAAASPGDGSRPSEQVNSGALAVLGYASVPAHVRHGHDKELRAQLDAIISDCRRRGLMLREVVREREPDRRKGLERPGLGYALQRIADGEANGLVVADLSRVSRSVTDLGEVLEWFSQAEARFVAVTSGLDTGEQSGQLAAHALIRVSRFERQRLSERTRKGLEAARLAGRNGGRSGVADNPELRDWIAQMRAQGMTLQAIADRLNEAGVPTIRGGAKWRPSSVQAAVGYRRPQRAAPEAPRASGSPDEEE